MKFFDKLKSVKNWIALWCLIMISYIVFKNQVEFFELAKNLTYVLISYVFGNVMQKGIFNFKKGDLTNENKSV